MNKYKALILDLDGTLLDTIEDLRDAVNYVLEKYGEPTHDLPTIKSFVGNGNKMLMEHSLKGGKSHPHFEEYLKEYVERYLANDTVKTRPYPGIMEVLEYCRDNGIKTAVLSNKLEGPAKHLISHFFGDLIPVVLGDTQKAPIKPAPDPGYKVCEILGVDISECLYVGDSDVDAEFAQNIGVDCLLALYGFKPEEFLKTQPCMAFIKEPKEILLYL